MKALLFSLALLSLLSFRLADGFYALPLKTIDGATLNLTGYQGKKVLFVVVPLSAGDTTLTATELAQLQSKYPTLTVLGVPSTEAGFTQSGAQALKALYQNAGPHFSLTEGMQVKKGSGQHGLFQWLTDKSKNKHFDRDVEGTGTKFFVDETGELYAVIDARVKLSSPLIDRIVTKP